MIGRLTGKVVECAPDRVLLEVGGVGYLVHVPLSTYYQLSTGSARPVTLHVHTHVREEALQLFGFASRPEQQAFELLLVVNGVGPRMALAILSGIGAEELRRAVLGQDRARLQQIPGVGRKTAERLLLELRDPVERWERAAAASAAAAGGGPAAPPPGDARLALREDALSALLNLGYPRDRAERALEGVLREADDDVSLQELLKRALKGMLG